jgi:hypothetical protein
MNTLHRHIKIQRGRFTVSPDINKMFSDCAGMLTHSTSCHVIAGNLSQATATFSSLVNCKVQAHVKRIQMSTECSHAIILQTIYHRGNTAERYIKEYLVPAGPCKRKTEKSKII